MEPSFTQNRPVSGRGRHRATDRAMPASFPRAGSGQVTAFAERPSAEARSGARQSLTATPAPQAAPTSPWLSAALSSKPVQGATNSADTDAGSATRTRRTRGRRSKGRHAASPNRALPPATGRLPLTLGLGIALATTTSFTVAAVGGSGNDERVQPGEAGAAVALTDPSSGTAAAVPDRQSGASRSQQREPLETPRAGITVPRDATMPVEEAAPVQVEAPPVLPGCDGEPTGSGLNGQVPESELCALWDGYPPIRADAAVALARLNQAYTEQFGEPMCLTDGYRSYAQQVAAKAAKPTLTATPGRSNHGWGLAVDICADSYAGERWDWLKEHSPEYGWDNPQWAQWGGSGPYEPWHWEFTAAVAQIDGNH